MSTVRWVSIVMHEHCAPNLTEAQTDAMEAWGANVLHTQSYASWMVGVEEQDAIRRNATLNIRDLDEENEANDEGCQ
jgi:hypothetical protein